MTSQLLNVDMPCRLLHVNIQELLHVRTGAPTTQVLCTPTLYGCPITLVPDQAQTRTGFLFGSFAHFGGKSNSIHLIHMPIKWDSNGIRNNRHIGIP